MVATEEKPSMVTEEEALRRVGEYLRNLFHVEVIYDITDKIARSRSVSDLLEGLYAALRLQEKLKREMEKQKRSVYIPGEQDIGTVRRLAEVCRETVRLSTFSSKHFPCEEGTEINFKTRGQSARASIAVPGISDDHKASERLFLNKYVLRRRGLFHTNSSKSWNSESVLSWHVSCLVC